MDLNNDKIYAIKIKGLGTDANSINQYEWATPSQFEALMSAYDDPVRSTRPFRLGDCVFRLSDFISGKAMRVSYARELPSFKPYVLEALEREKKEQAKLENPEGKARLNVLKAQHRIGGGLNVC